MPEAGRLRPVVQVAGVGTSPPEIASILNGNRDRFLAFLTRRVGSREAAEDILQAAFLKIVEKGAAPFDQERVEAWFYRILRNAVVDHYRRRGAEARSLEILGRDEEPGGPLGLDLEQAVCACVRDVVGALKPEYRDIVRRVDLEEIPLAEVSLQMGLTANNATVRLHRARAALRKLLGEVCGACTEHGCLSCACRRKAGTGTRPHDFMGGQMAYGPGRAGVKKSLGDL